MSDVPKDLAGADHFYDCANWDCTYGADTVSELADEIGDGEFMRVGRLKALPDRWLACVVTAFDEYGDALITELRWFDTEEAARQAVAHTGETS